MLFPCEPDPRPTKPCTGLSGISEDLSLSHPSLQESGPQQMLPSCLHWGLSLCKCDFGWETFFFINKRKGDSQANVS